MKMFELTVQPDGAICFSPWILGNAFIRAIIVHRNTEYG